MATHCWEYDGDADVDRQQSIAHGNYVEHDVYGLCVFLRGPTAEEVTADPNQKDRFLVRVVEGEREEWYTRGHMFRTPGPPGGQFVPIPLEGSRRRNPSEKAVEAAVHAAAMADEGVQERSRALRKGTSAPARPIGAPAAHAPRGE